MLDALNTTLAPVIFSHSSARGVHNVTRNADDEVLLQLVGFNLVHVPSLFYLLYSLP